MRAGRLGRFAGLVLALAVAIGAVTAASGGFTTFGFDWAAGLEFDWNAPHPVIDLGGAGDASAPGASGTAGA